MTSAEPYCDNLEHLFDELGRLDLLLKQRVEAGWADAERTVDEYRGLYISNETVERLIYQTGTARTETQNREKAAPAEIGRLAQEIRERKAASWEAGIELRLEQLAELFNLDSREIDVLLIGLASEVDLRYETLYSYLQDDMTKKRPTVDLTLDLLCQNLKERIATREVFGRNAPLIRNRLVVPRGAKEDIPLLARSIAVDERIVEYLLGSDEIDRTLRRAVELQIPEPKQESIVVDTSERETVDQLVESNGSPMAFVSGPYGSGRRAVAEAVSRNRGKKLLTLDTRKIPDDDIKEMLERTQREALLQDATLHIAALNTRSEDEREETVMHLDAYPGVILFSDEEPWRPRQLPAIHEFVELSLAVPSYELRRTIWSDALRIAGANIDQDHLDVDGLATKFRLTEGQIRDAVAAGSLANKKSLSNAALYRACRRQSERKLGSLARKVETTYGWDDIVLPTDRKQQLREVAARIEHRGKVYDQWGFEERFSLGNGLVVLFTGQSGTGKTMAAEIIAHDAELDLYKIDLSSVVSKYIGETEKNLKTVFDEAETGDAVLLFDEAESLFGERSEVHDSHDRYANIEVDYLLQRIEEHDGTVILTTNFKQNIDDAFMRRIHLSIDFPFPERESRLHIWQNVFPGMTPLVDIDYEFLAELEFTGGNIKNIALTAAFLAAEEGREVEMEQLVRAARREFQKTGRLVDPDAFKEYRELIV